MSLSLYNQKRHFKKTPEPKGKVKSSSNQLRFVIQKHDASHLHYDFRLEMEGVLKSWAIPKGPSMNPADKRLAMMVEDHPYDYRDFEGVIPEGNYGGGTVIVWDEGTYEPIGVVGVNKKDQEKHLLHQLKDGSIKIIMDGKKIKGEFALFLMKGKGDRSWILMKHKDEYSTIKDILVQDKSAKTGKTLFEVARENGASLHHPEGKNKSTVKPKPIQLLPAADLTKKSATVRIVSTKLSPAQSKDKSAVKSKTPVKKKPVKK